MCAVRCEINQNQGKVVVGLKIESLKMGIKSVRANSPTP